MSPTDHIRPTFCERGHHHEDGNGAVLNQRFEPIPGLFAVGNASGGRFPLQYTSPMNGISIGMATVLGALTGEYIGTEAPVVSTGDSATSAQGTV